MAFIVDLNKKLNSIEQQTFNEAGDIVVHLTEGEETFLKILSENGWFEKFNVVRATTYSTDHSAHYKLKKASYNSIEKNKINPSYINKVKMAMESYLSQLASNWQICTQEQINNIRAIEKGDSSAIEALNSSDVFMIRQKVDSKLGSAQCVIHQILKAWDQKNTIFFLPYATKIGFVIYGKQDAVKRLSEIFKSEIETIK